MTETNVTQTQPNPEDNNVIEFPDMATINKANDAVLKTTRAVCKSLLKGVTAECKATNKAARREASWWSRNQEEVPVYRILQSVAATSKNQARYMHLAYMFLRGTPYHKVEQSVRPGNEADPVKIVDAIRIIQVVSGLSLGMTPQNVETWVSEAA